MRHFLGNSDFQKYFRVTFASHLTRLKKLNPVTLRKHSGMLRMCWVFTPICGFGHYLLDSFSVFGLLSSVWPPLHTEKDGVAHGGRWLRALCLSLHTRCFCKTRELAALGSSDVSALPSCSVNRVYCCPFLCPRGGGDHTLHSPSPIAVILAVGLSPWPKLVGPATLLGAA